MADPFHFFMHPQSPKPPQQTLALVGVLALATAPLFLNDLAYLDYPTVTTWLAVDWGSKLLSGGTILAFASTRRLAALPVPGTLTVSLLIALIVATILDWWFSPWLIAWGNDLIPAPAKFGFTYPNEMIRLLDLGPGLLLTAVVEEVLFRKVLFLGLMRGQLSRNAAAATSIILFALCHWSMGIGACLSALLFGVIAQIIFIHGGKLWPVIAAHWIYDFFWFA